MRGTGVDATYIEVVDFQKFKQVHAHQFKSDAQVLSENHVVIQMDHVHNVLRVVLFQELQDFELNSGLIVVLLLVLDDLNRDINTILVVEALQSRAK